MENKLTNEDIQILNDLTQQYSENLVEYTKSLVDSINKENFEEASFYRDRINSLTKQTVLMFSAITGKDEQLINEAFTKEQEFMLNEIKKDKTK